MARLLLVTIVALAASLLFLDRSNLYGECERFVGWASPSPSTLVILPPETDMTATSYVQCEECTGVWYTYSQILDKDDGVLAIEENEHDGSGLKTSSVTAGWAVTPTGVYKHTVEPWPFCQEIMNFAIKRLVPSSG